MGNLSPEVLIVLLKLKSARSLLSQALALSASSAKPFAKLGSFASIGAGLMSLLSELEKDLPDLKTLNAMDAHALTAETYEGVKALITKLSQTFS
jgi:hypothetical protein